VKFYGFESGCSFVNGIEKRAQNILLVFLDLTSRLKKIRDIDRQMHTKKGPTYFLTSKLIIPL